MSEEKQASKDMQELNKQELAAEKEARERAEVVHLRPLTDIHENSEGVKLFLDLPGVNKDSLSIDIDKNVLTIKGEIKLDLPEQMKARYIELNSGVFERQFTLGDELDSASIDAKLKHGVLELSIPRLQQHQPRKIEIKVA
jgi:HSP20 family molecular chaperone IbpA